MLQHFKRAVNMADSTTAFSVLTTGNASWENTNSTNATAIPRRNYDRSDVITRMSAKYITLSLVVICVNLLIVFLLLTSKDSRRKPFSWHIISLSVWFTIIGIFIMPLNLEYFVSSKWSHGKVMCKIWIVLRFNYLVIETLIILFASVDRMLAKVQLVSPLNQKVMNILNYGMVIFPWGFVIAICFPLTLAAEKKFEDDHPYLSKHCFYNLDEVHYQKGALILFVFPLSILALNIFVSVLFYVLKEGSWDRIPNTTTEMEIVSVRMSTVALWISGVIAFVSRVPVTVFIMMVSDPSRDFRECPISHEFGNIALICTEVTTAIIPFMWFVTVEVRESAASWVQTVGNVIRKRKMNIDTSMNWLSRNEAASTQ